MHVTLFRGPCPHHTIHWVHLRQAALQEMSILSKASQLYTFSSNHRYRFTHGNKTSIAKCSVSRCPTFLKCYIEPTFSLRHNLPHGLGPQQWLYLWRLSPHQSCKPYAMETKWKCQDRPTNVNNCHKLNDIATQLIKKKHLKFNVKKVTNINAKNNSSKDSFRIGIKKI